MWAFEQVVPPLIEAFNPDVLVSQLGIDTHFRDPITHLALTVQGFTRAVTHFVDKTPKWLALGGGGYDIQAVARAWASAFGVMTGQDLPDKIHESYAKGRSVVFLSDRGQINDVDAFQEDAMTFAEASVKSIQKLVFPIHSLSS